jgi:endonuclease YncB( thermonuclease family)
MAVWACGVVMGGTLWMLLQPAQLFGRAPVAAGIVAASADQVAVVDGETLRLQETVVRLIGVAAPGRGQVCHRGDGTAFDCGAASAESLAHLVAGHNVSCRLLAHDEGERTLAICEADGRGLNQAQVIGGWARARAEKPGLAGPRLDSDETEARARHRGLWAGLFDPKS